MLYKFWELFGLQFPNNCFFISSLSSLGEFHPLYEQIDSQCLKRTFMQLSGSVSLQNSAQLSKTGIINSEEEGVHPTEPLQRNDFQE